MNNNVSSSQIIKPNINGNEILVVVISNSEKHREELEQYLIELGYNVGGPFGKVEPLSTFLTNHKPDLLIFDTNTTQSQLMEFQKLLKSDGKNLPLLKITNPRTWGILHNPSKSIEPPLNPAKIDKEIKQLIDFEEDDMDDDPYKVLEFTNQIVQKIIEMIPSKNKHQVKNFIKQSVSQFSERNHNFQLKEEKEFAFDLQISEDIDKDQFKKDFIIMIAEIINGINKVHDANWGKSMVKDVIQNIVMSFEKIPSPIKPILAEFDINHKDIVSSLATAVPDQIKLNRNVMVAKIVLSDLGPELETIVSSDESLINEFDSGVSSQLITLVGQGSSYHEGIFGPIPIPKSEDIVAVIRSLLVDSEIKDHRMEGKSLVVIAICMKREIMNLIPNREKLENIFSPLDGLKHESEITRDILKTIEKNYVKEIS